MRTLTFVADKQVLRKQGDFSGLVIGTSGYLRAQFTFSGDWTGYRKVAVFRCNGAEYPVLLSGNTCKVPDEAAACQTFRVYVVGKSGDSQIRSGHVTVIQRRY